MARVFPASLFAHAKAKNYFLSRTVTPHADQLLISNGYIRDNGTFREQAEPVALEDILDFVRGIAARDKAAFLDVDDGKVAAHLCDYNALIDIARQYVKDIGE